MDSDGLRFSEARYCVCRSADRITMLFAGAQKSIAMGAPLATVLFAPDVAGIVLLPILLYHLVQLVLAAPLAARLSQT